MASWFNSLETVLRTQNLLLWLAIVAAVTAALSSGTAFWLSRRAGTLRQEQTSRELVSLQAEKQDHEDAAAEIALLRQELSASQERTSQLEGELQGLEQQVEEFQAVAERNRDRAAAAERRISQAEAAAARATATDQPTLPGGLTEREKQKLREALQGKPAGNITLISVSGSSESANLAADLDALLRRVGWRTTIFEAVFQSPPEGLAFVVQNRQNMPQGLLPLSVGLTIIDLMPMPARVQLNPNRPPDFLGLIVGVR